MKKDDKPIVFVVDDDPSVREALDSLIRSIKLNVLTFSSAAEFLSFKRPDVPGCLVLDVRLPELNGLDFQHELAKSNVVLPIVFISAHGDIRMSVRAIKAGAIDFLAKPFCHQDLIDAIHAGIDQDRARRQTETILLEIKDRFALLTARERQVMLEVVRGRLNKQIAAKFKISELTVKVHRAHLMHKMKAQTLVDLVRMADDLHAQADVGIGHWHRARPNWNFARL
ncbi:MAG TPA: response regulator transcription factor [Pseudolabrys sp.]|nr:response regulator transcription factor [Pseudolabrys sp.]